MNNLQQTITAAAKAWFTGFYADLDTRPDAYRAALQGDAPALELIDLWQAHYSEHADRDQFDRAAVMNDFSALLPLLNFYAAPITAADLLAVMDAINGGNE